MKISERQLIAYFANKIAGRIVVNSIKQFQKLKDTLSGFDSGLTNTWDEICVKIQDEYSFKWDLYEDTIHNLVNEAVNQLERNEKLALCLENDSSLFSDEEEDDIEYDHFKVCQYVISEIFGKAGSWRNKRVRKFLEKG